ncbi:MAG: UvrB/UvrC motif-containing protein [Eubacteriales bacterium]
MEKLKQELQEAVNHEEYERAAEIRDNIRGLENEIG